MSAVFIAVHYRIYILVVLFLLIPIGIISGDFKLMGSKEDHTDNPSTINVDGNSELPSEIMTAAAL